MPPAELASLARRLAHFASSHPTPGHLAARVLDDLENRCFGQRSPTMAFAAQRLSVMHSPSAVTALLAAIDSMAPLRIVVVPTGGPTFKVNASDLSLAVAAEERPAAATTGRDLVWPRTSALASINNRGDDKRWTPHRSLSSPTPVLLRSRAARARATRQRGHSQFATPDRWCHVCCSRTNSGLPSRGFADAGGSTAVRRRSLVGAACQRHHSRECRPSLAAGGRYCFGCLRDVTGDAG